MSDRKLLSRICPASSGRNGRNSDATAMLTMLPRLALVVVRTYLSVLANVRRPSSMPAPDDVQVALQQHEVRGLARDVHRLLDREARVGRVHRRRIVHAVAEEADDVPIFLSDEDDALLLVRVDLDEQIRALRVAPQRLVVQSSSSAPVSTCSCLRPMTRPAGQRSAAGPRRGGPLLQVVEHLDQPRPPALEGPEVIDQVGGPRRRISDSPARPTSRVRLSAVTRTTRSVASGATAAAVRRGG